MDACALFFQREGEFEKQEGQWWQQVEIDEWRVSVGVLLMVNKQTYCRMTDARYYCQKGVSGELIRLCRLLVDESELCLLLLP